MKLNKFFILISLLLVLVVSMSMVSATEDIKRDIISEDIDNVALNDISVNDEEIVNLESTNDELDFPGERFKQLQSAIDKMREGKRIYRLESDFIRHSSEPEFQNGVNITKGVTIDGQGHTINGQGRGMSRSDRGRGFYISGGGEFDLVLKNINFVNFSPDSGGAICGKWAKGIKIINCTFINCTALNGYGGAIYIWSAQSLDIEDCVFINCKAPNGKGGAIAYSRLSDGCTVKNSVFTNCIDKEGYALREYRLKVENCTFNGCKGPDSASESYPDFRTPKSNSNGVSNSVGNMENCGTPLIVLLIALISLPILRRKK